MAYSRHLIGSVAALYVLVGLNLRFTDAGWNYKLGDVNGPDYWYLNFPDCGGVMQSPINISDADALYDPNLQLFDLSDYSETDGVVMTLENVGGHTAEVIFSGQDLFISGGSLPDVYKLEQFHFHWGHDGSRGSEHCYNGQFYPMELHLVHSQHHLPNVSVASAHPFGLAVIGIRFTIGQKNDKYDQLVKYFSQIQNADDQTQIPPFSVMDLLPASPPFHYYRYHGSLTTPPCHESVIWSFLDDHVEISQAQMDIFRSLFDDEHHQLVDDFRPIQNLNNRTIYTTKSTAR